MKYLKIIKSTGIICVACTFILGSIFVFTPSKNADAAGQVLVAKSSNKSSSSKSSKPAKKPSTSKTKKSSAPAGGKKSNNAYAKKSLSGDCKKVAGKCVVFSKSGCGNFYIKGRHYGGSQSCKILKKNCGNNNNNNNNGTITVTRTINVFDNNSTTTLNNISTSALQRECTPGVDCPDGDLGPIIRQTLVTPAYAGKNTKTCPLFWVSGGQTDDSTIKCTLVYKDGTRVDVPTNPISEGYEAGYPLPTGKSTLVCVRSTKYDENTVGEEDGREVVLSTVKKVNVETQERVVECKPNPTVREI